MKFLSSSFVKNIDFTVSFLKKMRMCAIIHEQFSMEIDHALFLFCGRKCDRIKAILKEPDGIVMIYKRLTAQGSYRWPRDRSEVRNLTWREFDWLMSGIDIEQPKAIKTT